MKTLNRELLLAKAADKITIPVMIKDEPFVLYMYKGLTQNTLERFIRFTSLHTANLEEFQQLDPNYMGVLILVYTFLDLDFGESFLSVVETMNALLDTDCVPRILDMIDEEDSNTLMGILDNVNELLDDMKNEDGTFEKFDLADMEERAMEFLKKKEDGLNG